MGCDKGWPPINLNKTMIKRLVKQTLHALTTPRLLHWLLPYLMALVLAGTVAQKTIGLYDSQKLFFSSLILWWGWLPLPGGRAVSALLMMSLLAKLIFASPWRKATAGIFIAHLGVLMLLLGGLITSVFGIEGYLSLKKNEQGTQFFDYHQRLLTIRKNDISLLQIPLADMHKNQQIADNALPFTLHIQDSCRNCTMALRADKNASLKGSAQKVKLAEIPAELEDERNFAGIELAVSGIKSEADGTYILFEPMEHQPRFTIGNDIYNITLGRASYALPFALQLLDADKETHPGTDVPRSFRSSLLLIDGNLQQRATITMNHPLRYKGYTIYQSSFNSGEGSSAPESVSFAIVKNSGRAFPYVASITLCIGLLIHLCFRLPTILRRSRHAS